MPSSSAASSSSSYPSPSNRDIVNNLLRSCGLEHRQTDRDRWMLHRFKFNRYDEVTEGCFGKTIRMGNSSRVVPPQLDPTQFPFARASATAVDDTWRRHQRNTRNSGSPFWKFYDHKQIGQLTKMKKLHLLQFQAMDSLKILNKVAKDMSDLECLILDQCQFLDLSNGDENDDDDDDVDVADDTVSSSSDHQSHHEHHQHRHDYEYNIFPSLTKLMVLRPTTGQRQQDNLSAEFVNTMKQFMKFVVQTMPQLQEIHFSFVPFVSSSDTSTTASATSTRPPTEGEAAATTGSNATATAATASNSFPATVHDQSEPALDSVLNVVLDIMVEEASSSSSSSSSSSAPSFATNLKVFTWNHSGMKNDELRCLLRDVLPLFPSMQSVSVQNNRISSLIGLIDTTTTTTQQQQLGPKQEETNRDDHSQGCKFVNISPIPPPYPWWSLSLRTLNLQHNPVMKKLHSGNIYRADVNALRYLLEYKLPFCGSLSAPWEDWEPCIEYELRVNRSGGRIVFLRRRNNDDDNNNILNNSKTTRSSSTLLLPPSLFPLILHRSYSHPSSSQGFLPAGMNHPNHATAMYFLLRSFPELIHSQNNRQ